MLRHSFGVLTRKRANRVSGALSTMSFIREELFLSSSSDSSEEELKISMDVSGGLFEDDSSEDVSLVKCVIFFNSALIYAMWTARVESVLSNVSEIEVRFFFNLSDCSRVCNLCFSN